MLFSVGVNILGPKYQKNEVAVVEQLRVVSSVVHNEVSASLRLLPPLRSGFSPTIG